MISYIQEVPLYNIAKRRFFLVYLYNKCRHKVSWLSLGNCVRWVRITWYITMLHYLRGCRSGITVALYIYLHPWTCNQIMYSKPPGCWHSYLSIYLSIFRPPIKATSIGGHWRSTLFSSNRNEPYSPIELEIFLNFKSIFGKELVWTHVILVLCTHCIWIFEYTFWGIPRLSTQHVVFDNQLSWNFETALASTPMSLRMDNGGKLFQSSKMYHRQALRSAIVYRQWRHWSRQFDFCHIGASRKCKHVVAKLVNTMCMDLCLLALTELKYLRCKVVAHGFYFTWLLWETKCLYVYCRSAEPMGTGDKFKPGTWKPWRASVCVIPCDCLEQENYFVMAICFKRSTNHGWRT